MTHEGQYTSNNPKPHSELRLDEEEIDFCVQFANQHGLAALFDHLGLDGLGNHVSDLRKTNLRLEEQQEKAEARIEVELELRKAAYERIRSLEEQFESYRRVVKNIAQATPTDDA